MKENILKIADYIESLEQRIAALETRVVDTEVLSTRIAALEARVLELEQRPTAVAPAAPEPVVAPAPTPVVEPIVEKVVESIPTEAPLVEELPVEEPIVASPVEEPLMEVLPLTEPIEEEVPQVSQTPSPVLAPEAVAEPEAPVAAPTSVVAAEPAQPYQTSLFGAPVQDIRKAISLGDRFLFQRELFNGSAEKMQKTLDAINAMSSLEQAQQFVDANFNWNTESSTYDLFMNVLRRRF